jgi:hypothetical protein
MSDAARDAIAAREEAKRPRQNAVYGRVATKTSLMPAARPPRQPAAKPAPVVADVAEPEVYDLVTVEDPVPVPVDDSPDIE